MHGHDAESADKPATGNKPNIGLDGSENTPQLPSMKSITQRCCKPFDQPSLPRTKMQAKMRYITFSTFFVAAARRRRPFVRTSEGGTHGAEMNSAFSLVFARVHRTGGIVEAGWCSKFSSLAPSAPALSAACARCLQTCGS
jgi:hypothetical protein